MDRLITSGCDAPPRLLPRALPRAVFAPHPLAPAEGRQVFYAEFFEGESIAEYFTRQGITLGSGPWALKINGARVPLELAHCVRPKPGTFITLTGALAGGGGDSNPLRTVLMIALLVAAPQFGPALGTALGVSASIGSAIISIGGGLLINALLPPPRPQLAQASGLAAAPNTSPTYSLSGGSNRARRYEPMLLVLGTHRVFPDYGATFFTEYEGDDQYLYQIFHFGLAPLQTISDLKIGTTPIANYSGVSLQEPGTLAAAAKPGMTGNGSITARTAFGVQFGVYEVIYQGAGAWQVKDPAAVVVGTTTTGANFDNQIALRVIDGTVAYVAGDTWWCTITDTGALSLVAANVDTAAGADLAQNVAVTRSSSSNAMALAIDLVGQLYVTNDAGVLELQSVTWEIEYAVASSGNWIPFVGNAKTVTISNADRKTFRKTYRVDGLPGTQAYDVRVKQTSGVFTGQRMAIFSWTQLRTYQPDPATYKGQRRLAVKIKASGQLSGQLERLSALATTRWEAWTGAAWAAATTSNPAWLLRALLRGVNDDSGRRMFGGGLADADLDLASIKAWGAWCTTKGLTFNAVLDSAQTLKAALDTVAACGRATITYAAGKPGVIYDQAAQPTVAVFGPANIRAGSFRVGYVAEKLADEIVLRFVNPLIDWQQDEVRALMPGVALATQTATIDLFGCADKAMAGKEVALRAAAQFYRRRQIAFETDVEGLVVQRGDVIALSHDMTQWDYGGRVVRWISTTVLQLDRAVPRTALDYIGIRAKDGVYTIYQCFPDVGTSDTITIYGGAAVSAGDDGRDFVYQFGPRPTPGKLCKVTGVRFLDQGQKGFAFEVQATDEEAAYYAAETAGYTYVAPTDFGQKPEARSVKVTETLVANNPGLVRCSISWEARNTLSCTVLVGVNGGPKQTIGTFSNVSNVDFSAYDFDVLAIEVIPFGTLRADTSATLTYNVIGWSARPADVSGFTGEVLANTVRLKWNAHTEVDVKFGGSFEIRHSTATDGSAVWASAVKIGTAPGNATQVEVPALSGEYLIKALDSGLRTSVTEAGFITTVPAIIGMNVITTSTQDPGFSGTLANMEVIGARLQLAGDLLFDSIAGNFDDVTVKFDGGGGYKPAGSYDFSAAVDLGGVFTSRVTARLAVDIFSEDPADLDVTDVSTKIYVATTNDDPAGSPTWSAWQEFVSGDYQCRGYKFQLQVASGDIYHNAGVRELRVEVDMPDRLESDLLVAIPAGGKTVTFAYAYFAAPSVGVTVVNTQTGDALQVTGVSATGFTMQVLNNLGQGVARTGNYFSRGYGMKVA